MIACDIRPRVVALALSCLLVCSAAVNATDIDRVRQVVDLAYERFEGVQDGETAQYIPALAKADPDRFGIAVVTTSGQVVARGDTDHVFAIMSAAKPFTLALLLQQQGREVVLERIGVEPTGLPFNSLSGVERAKHQPLNPMVNAGAITAVSLLQTKDPEHRWPMLLDHYGKFAGQPLEMMTDVYESVSTSNFRNRGLINLLMSEKWLAASPVQTLDVYNRQSCVGVTARQLAVMGATLANAGVNPLSGERVLDEDLVDEVLSVMLLSGFYDESGRWAYNAGLPAKSGVGGGIVAVVPGEMAVVGYSPRLSPAGNSVRAMRAIEMISSELGLSIFKP
jgi:glutaminase